MVKFYKSYTFLEQIYSLQDTRGGPHIYGHHVWPFKNYFGTHHICFCQHLFVSRMLCQKWPIWTINSGIFQLVINTLFQGDQKFVHCTYIANKTSLTYTSDKVIYCTHIANKTSLTDTSGNVIHCKQIANKASLTHTSGNVTYCTHIANKTSITHTSGNVVLFGNFSIYWLEYSVNYTNLVAEDGRCWVDNFEGVLKFDQIHGGQSNFEKPQRGC